LANFVIASREAARQSRLDCFAAVQQQFILSAAAGGVEGLAMTAKGKS
jgi:hypothetical protein